MTQNELDLILKNHAKWLAGVTGGIRADLTRANLTRADLACANLRGADLTRADLTRADLRGADLTRANLRGADLTLADLRGADLRGADLACADLTSANLRGVIGQIYVTQRSDGHQFFLVMDEGGGWFIRAGCQYRTIESYRQHALEYNDESKTAETNLILDFAEAKLKEYLK